MFNTRSSLICICGNWNSIIFFICISNDYNVYSFGFNKYGAHGHKEELIKIPTQINNLTNIKMISANSSHCVCINYDGEIFSFGNNSFGQLGIGKAKNLLTHIPQQLHLPPCKQVSCGNDFTICLTEDNKLYSFGSNYKGQLGLGNYNEYYSSPQLILELNNIEYIVCGTYHVICKTYDNEIYSWGDNNCGQLGQGNNNSFNKPIQCLNWPNDIIDIKCGGSHSILLTSICSIYSFGWNCFGQLGINDENTKESNTPTLIKDIPEIQRIECGNNHSICIDINNNLWLFGNNLNGKLGLGDTEDRYKPIIHPTLSNIIDISSGGDHTFVKTIENKIYAFGYNNLQLGIETSEDDQLTPIQVLEGNEDIWCSTIGKSKQKSARK